MYTVGKIKPFIEGWGYKAILYCDGKRIADVIADANGGPLDLRFDDPEQEQRLRNYVATLPAHVCSFVDTETGKPAVIPVTVNLFVEDLVNKTQAVTRVKRLMRTSVIVIECGELCQFKIKPTPEEIASIQRENPKAVILNGLSDDDLFARVFQINA